MLTNKEHFVQKTIKLAGAFLKEFIIYFVIEFICLPEFWKKVAAENLSALHEMTANRGFYGLE